MGPPASSGEGFIVNSPLYYWVLALIWKAVGSVWGVSLIYVIFSISLIITGCIVGLTISGLNAGLLMAFFIAVGQVFVDSRIINANNLMLAVEGVSLAMLFSIIRSKSANAAVYIGYICLLFAALHLHPSFAPIFITGSLWLMWHVIRNIRRIGKDFLWILGVYTMLFVTVGVMIKGSLLTLIVSHSASQMNLTVVDFIRFSISQFVNITHYLFGDFGYGVSIIITTCLFIGLLYVTHATLRTKEGIYALVFLSLLVSSVISSGYQFILFGYNDLPSYYLLPYVFVYITAIVYLLTHLRLCRFVQVLCIVVVSYLLLAGNRTYLESFPNRYKAFERASLVLVPNTREERKPFAYVVVGLVNTGGDFVYASASFWYFLEGYFQTALVRFDNYNALNNYDVIPLERNPKTYYLFCFNDLFINTKIDLEACSRKFEQDYYLNIKLKSKTIIPTTHQGDFSIYGFSYEAKTQ